MNELGWKQKDENKANAEGWTLHSIHPHGENNFGIGYYEDAQIFDEDENALKFVLKKARTFDLLATKAVHFLSHTNPDFAFPSTFCPRIRYNNEDELYEHMSWFAGDIPEIGELIEQAIYPVYLAIDPTGKLQEYFTEQSFNDKYGNYINWRSAVIAQSMLNSMDTNHK